MAAHPAPDRAAGTPVRRRALPGRLVYAVTAGVALIWLLLDQATKVIAVETLQGRGVVEGPIPFLEWELIRNTNAAFDIPGFTGMFVIVSIIVVIVVARALPRTDRLSLALAYGLVTGGAAGNMVDRLFREPGFPDGGVVDFIRIGWWPKFNLADTGIVVGAAMIVLLMFLVDRDERELEAARTRTESIRPETAGPRG